MDASHTQPIDNPGRTTSVETQTFPPALIRTIQCNSSASSFVNVRKESVEHSASPNMLGNSISPQQPQPSPSESRHRKLSSPFWRRSSDKGRIYDNNEDSNLQPLPRRGKANQMIREWSSSVVQRLRGRSQSVTDEPRRPRLSLPARTRSLGNVLVPRGRTRTSQQGDADMQVLRDPSESQQRNRSGSLSSGCSYRSFLGDPPYFSAPQFRASQRTLVVEPGHSRRASPPAARGDGSPVLGPRRKERLLRVATGGSSSSAASFETDSLREEYDTPSTPYYDCSPGGCAHYGWNESAPQSPTDATPRSERKGSRVGRWFSDLVRAKSAAQPASSSSSVVAAAAAGRS